MFGQNQFQSQNNPGIVTKDGKQFMLVEIPQPGPSNNPAFVNNNGDPVFDEDFTPFYSKELRMSFLRKVYGILTTQLLITFLIVYFTINSFDASLWIRQNPWVIYLSLGITLIIMLTLACCPHLGQIFPLNFILLGIFTFCKCILLTVFCWFYQSEDILFAMGVTLAIFVVLTVFAMQTKFDFTVFSGFLLIFFLILLVIGIVTIFFQNLVLHIVYSSLVVFAVSMAIVIDTQLMLIGKHQHSFGPKDFVFGALVLYVDIITLFIHVLRLIGLVKTDS